MHRRRQSGPLPLHLWLGAALIALVTIPLLAAGGAYGALRVWHDQQDQSAQAHLAAAQRVVAATETRWDDPAWQASARTRLVALGVAAQLFLDGRLVFATTRAFPAAQFKQDPTHGLLLRGATSDTEAALVAPGADVQPGAGALVAGLAAVLLTLAGVGWALRRTVVRPLAATSQAARQMAMGHLDVPLPPSQVREVADVSAALEIMSAGLRAAEQQHATLDQERRLFIGAIVHDLRTPLFTLRGYLTGLENGLATTPDKIGEYVAECRAKADALERLIVDLFTYTRLDYLEQAPQCEPLELGALLHQVAADMQPQAEAKGIALVLDGPSEVCPLLGDGHLLARTVQNLLDNALRHTPAAGRIVVRWRQDVTALQFTVEDTGSGIAAHDLPHLFTPLYRGETSRNRQTGGAGLGLTIARRILKAHGGDLVAANRKSGGAVFTGTLPVDHISCPLAAPGSATSHT